MGDDRDVDQRERRMCIRPVLVAFLVATLLNSACSCDKAPKGASEPVEDDVETYAVYRAAVLETVGRDARQVVIQSQTIPPDPVLPIGTCDDGVACEDWTLERHFSEQSATVLEERFGLSVPVTLLDEKQLQAASRCTESERAERWDWKCFYRRYPDSAGYLKLSRVAFNRSRRRALVYVERFCGSACGRGAVLLLEKGESAWFVVRAQMAWVS